MFIGDSGTGKTLAAEVIARELNLSLLKMDLAQLVSDWVGETEKNSEAAFREAEASHAMLFFDEADTFFGKRAEMKQGGDRYAKLEAGFLLLRGPFRTVADDLSDPMVVAAAASEELGHGSVSGTLGCREPARTGRAR